MTEVIRDLTNNIVVLILVMLGLEDFALRAAM
jgi:hypothetical protein